MAIPNQSTQYLFKYFKAVANQSILAIYIAKLLECLNIYIQLMIFLPHFVSLLRVKLLGTVPWNQKN